MCVCFLLQWILFKSSKICKDHETRLIDFGPVHTEPFLFENGDFFSVFKKFCVHTLRFWIVFTRPHENAILTIENGTIFDGSNTMTKSFLKTSVFILPHVDNNGRFQKCPLWRAFLKRWVFGDRSYRIRVDWVCWNYGKWNLLREVYWVKYLRLE